MRSSLRKAEKYRKVHTAVGISALSNMSKRTCQRKIAFPVTGELNATVGSVLELAAKSLREVRLSTFFRHLQTSSVSNGQCPNVVI